MSIGKEESWHGQARFGYRHYAPPQRPLSERVFCLTIPMALQPATACTWPVEPHIHSRFEWADMGHFNLAADSAANLEHRLLLWGGHSSTARMHKATTSKIGR